MLGLSLIAIASAFVLASMHITPEDNRQFLLVCLVLSVAINAVQTAMYALAAHVYPTEIRATGIGVAVAMGRVGNVLASYVGNCALSRGGLSAFFLTFGLGMIVVFLALAFVRRHIGNRIAQPASVEVPAPSPTNS
jgi:AAHS family 4-hydroxybenzoate transporter-like MFS transporter